MRDIGLIVVGLVLIALSACGSGDADPMGGGADAGAVQQRCTEPGSLCVTTHVPPGFAGTPTQIIVGLFDALPPQGPPNAVAAIIEEPEIGVGMPFDITAVDIENPDDYLVYIVLYMEGGGTFQPVSGIDYVAQTRGKMHIGEAPVNMAAMTFELFEE